jgi:hypothetical protein
MLEILVFVSQPATSQGLRFSRDLSLQLIS